MGKRLKLSKAPEPIRLDLGCGQRAKEGFIGVDYVAGEGVGVVHNLAIAPWPWKDSSVEETYSSHMFEHLTGEERITFMDEMWRILVPGGKATIIVPYWSSMRAVQDPTHKWPPLSETSFLYFNKGWRVANKLDHYPIKCDFDFSYGFSGSQVLANRSQEYKENAIRHYVNSVDDLQVNLTKKVD